MALAVAILFYMLLMVPALMLYSALQRRQRERSAGLSRRLGDPHTTAQARPKAAGLQTMHLVARLRRLPVCGRYIGDTLRQASMPLILAMPALLIAGTAACASWIGMPAALFPGLALAALPAIYLRIRHRRWLAAVSEQLPYLVDLLRAALGAGHTMLRALQMAAQNLPEPVASEVRVIVEQVQLGMPLPLALESMYERAPLEELGFLVAAVRIQSDIGSSLAEVFQHVADGMRSRERAEQQMRALTAQSRASAVIVTLLPFIVLAALSFINPAYSEPLFHRDSGVMMLKIAVALDTIAFFTMRRIARVDF